MYNVRGATIGTASDVPSGPNLPFSKAAKTHGVQIDNGFGAAMLAARMLRTAAKIRAKIDSSHRVEALAGQPGRLS